MHDVVSSPHPPPPPPPPPPPLPPSRDARRFWHRTMHTVIRCRGANRNIASGLRAFYSMEEMQGRRVIVLANLKARNIGGFKSNGMVSEA